MHELLLAADPVDPANTTVVGLIISAVTAVLVAGISKYQKRKRPAILTPAESAANLNFKNLEAMHTGLRAEFERYKTEREAADRDQEKNENDYRRQVGVEINEFRRQLAYKDTVIDLYYNDAIDVRLGYGDGRYPPAPPLPTRPPQTFGPAL